MYEAEEKRAASREWNLRQKIGLFLGPILFFIVLLVPIDTPVIAHRCLAAAVWIGAWWITEPIPLGATALLPLIFTPLLGIDSAAAAAAPYANKNVYLFMGGFLIAQALIKWDLHRRISLLIVSTVGISPKKIILGFMTAAAILSMFISNTATTVALMPIGLAIVDLVAVEIRKQELPIPTGRGEFNFGIALMLGIAFAATIGGLGTPIGTPPNIIFIGTLEELHPELRISFVKWMTFGIPIVLIFIPTAWFILLKIFPPNFKEIPGGKDFIEREIAKLGSWTKGQKVTIVIFILTVIMWLIRPFVINPYVSELIDDSTIAIIGAVLLFVFPISWERGELALDHEWAIKIPWPILLLFGGGLSLAKAIDTSGLALYLGDQLQVIGVMPPLLVVFTISIFTAFLSEVTSNTATTAMMMPIMAALASGTGTNPIIPMLTAALSASFVYLLPVGTPPNAVIYGSGYIRVIDMIKGGMWIKILHLTIGSLLIYYMAIPLFMNAI